MLKEFTDEVEFVREKLAFTRLIKNGQPPPHIIEFLGSYEQADVRYILLEYADIGTLDDYFRKTPSPTSERDIIHFFDGLFNLIKGLCRVHQLADSFVGYVDIRIALRLLADFTVLDGTKTLSRRIFLPCRSRTRLCTSVSSNCLILVPAISSKKTRLFRGLTLFLSHVPTVSGFKHFQKHLDLLVQLRQRYFGMKIASFRIQTYL